jgi:glycolate oxidase iron-sulfur subunit
MDRAVRAALSLVLPRTWLFGFFLFLGRTFKAVLPENLRQKIPAKTGPGLWPAPRHARRMLVLDGCVQPAIAPSINAAAARVLDRQGISLIAAPGAGCCGGIRFHLNRQEEGRDDMRALIDAWWPSIERGEIEAIVMTASGCGTTVKDFGHLLAHDSRYAEKAKRVSLLTRDLSEVLSPAELPRVAAGTRVAFQSPCSLQHGQQLDGKVEALLQGAGFALAPVRDAHLCCGSAGTYSLLQPELSGKLKAAKLKVLEAGRPDVIATANIGCLAHLADGAKRPVRHWIELLDARMLGGERAPS